MVRIKLENLGPPKHKASGTPLAGPSSSRKSGAGGVAGAVFGAPGTLAKGALTVGGAVGDGVADVLTSGLTGVFSLGKGFRDFILRGTVVELAVAVVLGTAFTNLISAATTDWITPLIAAIFGGTHFADLHFTINYSQFNYGHFINEFLVFILVCLILYLGVVLPLQKLQYAAFKHKAILRDCPCCLEEISMAATRCKFCCAEIEQDAEVQAVLQMAEAAMEAAEKKQHWCWKMLTCCVKRKTAVIESAPGGELTLKEVEVDDHEQALGLVRSPQSHSRAGNPASQSFVTPPSSSLAEVNPQQLSPGVSTGTPPEYRSPRSTFETAQSSPRESVTAGEPSYASGSMSIDIAGLQQQLKANFQRHK